MDATFTTDLFVVALGNDNQATYHSADTQGCECQTSPRHHTPTFRGYEAKHTESQHDQIGMFQRDTQKGRFCWLLHDWQHIT